MACLEHNCRDCGEVWCDNDPKSICPMCGSTNNGVYFDEQEDQ